MQTITVPYVLDQLTHSTVWVGLGAFCTFFPATVVGPVAGPLADRYSRRTVLLCSQVVLMLSALALWAVWVSGDATPGLIVGCVTVGAIGAGITIAAWQAFVPQLVPPEAMISAVRLNAMQFTGARAFGPALAALVLAQFGPGTAFLANALSFLLVIGALLLIAARPVTGRTVAGNVLSQFRDGLRYVRKRAVLDRRSPGRAALVAARRLDDPARRAVHASGAPPGPRQVRPARRGLRRGRDHRFDHHGGEGRLVPPFDAHPARVRDLRRRRDHVRSGAGLRARARSGCSGSGSRRCSRWSRRQTAVQVNVDEHYRGRVLSIYVMCFFAGTPIGALVGGIMAEVVGLRATIVGSAVLLAGCVAAVLARYPGLRVLDESRLGLRPHDGTRRCARPARQRSRHRRPPHRRTDRLSRQPPWENATIEW